MMMAYKAFRKDLTCTMGRGIFQYEEGKWFEEEEANCRKNGFHCAENPLDCLNYYGNMEESVYYIVLADGDINEDDADSKISCTRIKLVKKLTIEEFVLHALKYMYEHPQMEIGHVETDHGEARKDFVIVRGKNPIAKGAPGTVLGFVKEERGSRHVEELGVYTVGEQRILPDTWYDINGKVAAV